MKNQHPSLHIALDGCEVTLTRSEIDGRLLLIVDTFYVGEADAWAGGVPKLRLMVNDCIEELDEKGEWNRHE